MILRTRNDVKCFIYIFITSFHLMQLKRIALADNSTYVPSENIVLNCGSISWELSQYDGRNWTSDIGTPYIPSNASNKSLIAKAPPTSDSIPEVPYMTARVFWSRFTYRFNVTPGPKFIRLHFYPASFLGLDASKAFLSVTAGNFTLLHNFSVSLNTDYFNLAYLMKEFIIHVSGRTLELTFSPSSNASDAAYAFVNGIEVVSMPFSLYMRGADVPLPLVGHHLGFVYIYNDSALETIYRLNVGGDQIPPRNDTGMFRTWGDDDPYLFGGVVGIEPSNMSMPISYANDVPAYVAPMDVYRTSRSMTPYSDVLINLNYNLSWFFPVDSGFNYLVRLHFCETDNQISRMNEVVFYIYLNNQTAEVSFDPIALSGGPGVAVFQDYVVMVPVANEVKQDLWLDLHPNKYSKPMYYNSYLNGVEIFKLSYTDEKNLAGLNPFESKSGSAVKVPHVATKKSKKSTLILTGCGVAAVVLSILLCLILYRLKVVRPKRMMPCCNLFVCTANHVYEANKTPRGPHFSLEEIKVATNNFDEALIIGTGGFGHVYKGSFDGGASSVAIKRANSMSDQGVIEFETEIQLLSKLWHKNLVSLLGYCNEDGELILVYDFMANGTLYDHLHLRQRDQPPLSWIQRLEICIGVAKGLHYLHTGTQHRIIHRDIKTTNILIDHNWVAKISDFGLSKASYPSFSITNVKGSTGYMDPEYCKYQKLTEKSDLYSLGVVLLEVLSARPAVSPCEDDEDVNLAEWAELCYERGNLEQIVDPNLEGEIDKECFQIYLGIAMKCLAERGVERPSTGDVLQNLELAKQMQKNAGNGTARDGNVQWNDNSGSQGYSDLTPGIEFSDLVMPVGR